MIGRWPTLLLLLSVCNTIYTHIFFLSKVLSFAFVFAFFLFFALVVVCWFLTEFSHLILPLRQSFYSFFLPLKLPTTRDVNSTKAFLLEVSVTSVPPRSRSLSRERERKRSQHSFLYTFFATESKSPRIESLFQPTPAVFAPKKRENISSNHYWTRKFSRIKHARFKNKSERRIVPQRERGSFCWCRPCVWKRFKKTFWERQWERERKNFIFVVVVFGAENWEAF